MTSKRHFNGLAHDIAHHAQSGLSYLHPHVDRACHRNGVSEARLDLLEAQPWPAGFLVDAPLQMAASAIQEKFRQMVKRAGLEIQHLAAAQLTFRPLDRSSRPPEVRSLLTTKDGRNFNHTVAVDW